MSEARSRIEPFGYKVTEENGDDVMVEISEEDYEKSLAEGADPEYALKPGKHKFIRGGFRKRHPDFDSSSAEIKVHVSLSLDLEVLNFFKQRAGLKETDTIEAASVQINQVLREFVEGEKAQQSKPQDLSLQLLGNDQFINEVAKRVQEKLKDSAA